MYWYPELLFDATDIYTCYTDTLVGFEKTNYTVSEDAGSLEVCIDVQSPSMGSVTISTVDGTALGM